MVAGRGTDDDTAVTELAPDPAAVAVPEYEMMLSRELAALGTTRTAQLKRLRGARTPANQANASRALAGAYQRSATRLAQSPLPARLPPSAEAVVEALRRAAAAYRRLAAGAARDDRSVYETGRRAVRGAEVLLARRLEANLNTAGTR